MHKTLCVNFDQAIDQTLGPAAKTTDFREQDLTPENEFLEGSADSIDPDHCDLKVTPEIGENFIGAEIMIPCGGVLSRRQVTRRKWDSEGNPVGKSHPNPTLDTRSYILEFDNNDQTELTANLIAKSMYAQCDPDGNQYLLLADIVDHRSFPTAIKLANQKVVRADGRTYLQHSTAGWQLCCQWIDGSTLWEYLADLKNLHPVETAEYAQL